MTRRSLLTGDERRRLFELPVDDREVARHYTLSADDLKWIDTRHGPGNQLGAAVQLALLRHPGFGLRAGETIPSPVLRFLADQSHPPWLRSLSTPGAIRPAWNTLANCISVSDFDPSPAPISATRLRALRPRLGRPIRAA